jgi:hypothetical protein
MKDQFKSRQVVGNWDLTSGGVATIQGEEVARDHLLIINTIGGAKECKTVPVTL